MTEALFRTPLHNLHLSLGARMVPFAGHEMPVQYPTGIIAEHNWTRSNAGLFDVSHMGQAKIVGPNHVAIAAALEKLVPGDVLGLGPSRIRYTQLTNPEGGIIDDLMITRPGMTEGEGALGLVVNASRKHKDYQWIGSHLPSNVKLIPMEDRALIALQGPKAASVLARHARQADVLGFMMASTMKFDGINCTIARSGYTGEDGFEISVNASDAGRLVQALLAEPEVKPIGLGARDSLRLEAGLCLYGHDIDETTSPVEAELTWSIGKRRRAEGGFMGDARILNEIAKGPARRRVGIRPEGRAPAREGAPILSNGLKIGHVTSGGFGPSANSPIAMGYVEAGLASAGTPISITVRDKSLAAVVTALPFVSHNYKR